MKKKLLQIGKFFPPNWGGIETATVGNIEVFDRIEDWDLETAVHSNEKLSQSWSSVHSFEYRLIKNIPFSLRLIKFVTKKLSAYRCVIIHVPNPFPLVLVLFKKPRQIFCLYWHAPVSKKGIILGFLYNIFTRLFYSKFDYILVPTEEHIKTVPSYLKHKVFVLVDLFSTLELNTESSKVLEHIDTSQGKVFKPYFVCTGRYVKYKGFDIAIVAFSQFLKKNPGVELIIIGSGPEFDNYKYLTKQLEIEQSVVFLQNISNTEKLHKIAGALCLLMPSISNQEMYGLSQVEAYACRTPVVTTKLENSGVPIIAEASGSAIVVQPSSVSELQSAMERIWSSPELRKSMGESARKYYLKRHSIDTVERQFKTFLKEVMVE